MATVPDPESGPPDEEVFDLQQLLHSECPAVRATNLPRLALGALRLVHRAAPGELIFTSVLQIVDSLALVAQVLVGEKLLTTPLNTTPRTVSDQLHP